MQGSGIRTRRNCLAALGATAAVAALALATAPAARAQTAPSSLPAAGPVIWPSVAVRKAPSNRARRVTVLRELRRDYRPQIVLAIGMRRVGVVPPTRAHLALGSTAGVPALEVRAREAGQEGNAYRVSVRDVPETPGVDEFTIFTGVSGLISVRYAEGDIAGLAGWINGNPVPISAAALANGTPLAPIGYTPLAGGSEGKPGQLWYRLNLPIRPFGQTGWIPADAADVTPMKKRVVLDRSARVLSVYRGSRRIYRTRVAVGRPDRQTPLGSFYVAAKYVPQRNALVSTYALELSAPAGLPDFLRGGVVGIHGTPAVHTIGKSASNGCIRVRPSAALRLRRIVPLGAPVRVVR